MSQTREPEGARFRLTVVQMRSSSDPFLNLALVNDFVLEAQARQAELVCFPENVFYRGPKEGRQEAFLSRNVEGKIELNSDLSRELAEFAAQWTLPVSLGSVLEKDSASELPYNSHWMLRPGGWVSAYRKIHLFDFAGAQGQYKESNDVRAGDAPVAVDVGALRTGLSICYDLRFPELYRHLALGEGAKLLLVPSAFTRETGEAHWEILLRSRAVENLSFVAAAAQWGSHQNSQGRELFCYGHSIVIDPWGKVLAEAGGEGDELLVVDLELDELRRARERLPALQGARLLTRTNEHH